MHPEYCKGIARDRAFKKQCHLAYAAWSLVRCALVIQSDGSAFDPESKLTDVQRMNAFKKDRDQDVLSDRVRQDARRDEGVGPKQESPPKWDPGGLYATATARPHRCTVTVLLCRHSAPRLIALGALLRRT
jgi:hypothetical protein